jgi:hypothetical protein
MSINDPFVGYTGLMSISRAPGIACPNIPKSLTLEPLRKYPKGDWTKDELDLMDRLRAEKRVANKAESIAMLDIALKLMDSLNSQMDAVFGPQNLMPQERETTPYHNAEAAGQTYHFSKTNTILDDEPIDFVGRVDALVFFFDLNTDDIEHAQLTKGDEAVHPGPTLSTKVGLLPPILIPYRAAVKHGLRIDGRSNSIIHFMAPE